ncbi:N-6 DNA methylase [Halococcus saccharolyticus]|uniref:Restriction modification system DNA specificity subunit n=1 Tax=Halococcus saccharolyticus DSM 5350 TaxID=1227455 RepID=M0MFX1_9EURY|nr:N-6 DNA methylase [Halococcus saccharolyticus]EMA44263.1 restriction modification system DNA specificity subunit [Halococcus saccharolyticus DSM 5350]
MTEHGALEEVQRALEDKYGVSRVTREPALGEGGVSIRPDILVFKDKERTSPFLALEYSSLSTPHRRTEDIEQVRRYIEKTGAPFGAIVSEDLLYIFQVDQDDELIEVPVSKYPDIGDEPNMGPQPIGSHELFKFLIARIRDQLRSKQHQQVSEAFVQQLYRKYEADRGAVDVDIEDSFEKVIESLDASIQQRHDSYTPGKTPIDSPVLRTVFSVFSNYDLASTTLDIRRQIVDETFMGDFFDREGEKFTTPPKVAERLVELLDITDSDSVLDPASGWGYTLRAANEYTDEVVGVELNPGVNNAALFFNDLLEKSGTYVTADFLEMACREDIQASGNSTTLSTFAHDEEVTSQPQIAAEFDCIVLDPPFGGHPSDEVLDYLDEGRGVKLHEAFLSLALDQLADGGRLVAIVPTTGLVAVRSAWLREKIVQDYNLRGIIELSDAKLFPYLDSRFSLSVVVVDNHGGPTNEFTGIVCDEGSKDELSRAVAQVKNDEGETIPVKGASESLLPSELLGMEEAQQALHDRFDQVAPLEDFAIQIEGGARRSGDELEPYENPNSDISYLKLGANLYEWTTHVDGDSLVANPTDVLIGLKGTPGKVYHPGETVVPSSNWAIIRFHSEVEAAVYAAYLASQTGQKQVQSMARGSTIQYVPLRRIGDVIVPLYSDSELMDLAEKVQKAREEYNDEQRDYTAVDFEGVF